MRRNPKGREKLDQVGPESTYNRQTAKKRQGRKADGSPTFEIM